MRKYAESKTTLMEVALTSLDSNLNKLTRDFGISIEKTTIVFVYDLPSPVAYIGVEHKSAFILMRSK